MYRAVSGGLFDIFAFIEILLLAEKEQIIFRFLFLLLILAIQDREN